MILLTLLIWATILTKIINIFVFFFQNLANRKKPGCEKGTGVDRSRMNMTKCVPGSSRAYICPYCSKLVSDGLINGFDVAAR